MGENLSEPLALDKLVDIAWAERQLRDPTSTKPTRHEALQDIELGIRQAFAADAPAVCAVLREHLGLPHELPLSDYLD